MIRMLIIFGIIVGGSFLVKPTKTLQRNWPQKEIEINRAEAVCGCQMCVNKLK